MKNLENKKYLVKILINLNRDYNKLRTVLNAYRYGRGIGVDNVGGYEKNISEALILSKFYFPDLTSKIEDYSDFIDNKLYTTIFLKGFLTFNKESEIEIKTKGIEEKVITGQANHELDIKYNELEEVILSKFKEF